jgi:hypothetical protein
MKKQKIKVLIEMPTRWFDYESPVGIVSYAIRQELEHLLEEKVINKVVAELDLSSLKVTREEIKSRMLDMLAEKALKGGDK